MTDCVRCGCRPTIHVESNSTLFPVGIFCEGQVMRYPCSVRVVVCLLAVHSAALGLCLAGDEASSFSRLKQDHEKRFESINLRREQAKTDSERDAAQAEVWSEIKKTANQAFDWAESHKDDPESIDAIVWTVHGVANGYYAEYDAEIRRAFELLTKRALGDEKVLPVCYYADQVAMACPPARRFLEAALERSPSKLIQGAACLGLARTERLTARLARKLNDPITSGPLTARWSQSPELLKMLRAADPDANEMRARAYYAKVAAEYGNSKMPEPYSQMSFAELAKGELYVMDRLSTGMPAPELVGEDVRGSQIRLSEYRGKVVAIVFWATWCNPCMEMIPHERELVKRMEGRPFVLLGVNGDDDRSKASKAMDELSMNWPSLWSGTKVDSIAADWGVRSWPTIYVLDADGKIRYDAVRGADLDKAVDRLVEEAEAKAK
ncbi:redoxin domain-containing protein [bacterium]|nr:redoxin domain-containing protein [bacterium]